MDKISFSSYEAIQKHEGKELGVTDYLTITQERINQFAEATLDYQWIHTDVERAKKESPFGTTIAHGYLTMCLAPYFVEQVLDMSSGVKAVVNYGINSLRFTEPVKVDSKLRGRISLSSVKNLRGTAKLEMKIIFEMENIKKPACTAEVVYLIQFG